MPGKLQHQKLAKAGIDVLTNPYDRVDCLENKGDLEALFNILARHQNSSGLSPSFTFNTILGNPKFSAIRDSEFQEYFRENLFESYLRIHGEDLKPHWKKAIDEKLIRPQFHGREHLNVGLWLTDLRSGHADTMTAFNQNYYGHITKTSSPWQRNYLAAFWPQSRSHLEEIKDIVEDGLNIFERLFGYRSKTFIPCNYILPSSLERRTAELGVELIQGQRGQLRPVSDGSSASVRRSYTGERNRYGQIYAVRNVKFEPVEDHSRDWVALAMREISSAFFWRTPAIISTHRINYVSGMDVTHRDRNLQLLDNLLGRILATWPDVDFVSSDELVPLMSNSGVQRN